MTLLDQQGMITVAKTGDVTKAAWWLAHKADVNCSDKGSERTPLHIAIVAKQVDMVAFLVQVSGGACAIVNQCAYNNNAIAALFEPDSSRFNGVYTVNNSSLLRDNDV